MSVKDRMELLTASTGSYPRVGDKPEQQLHRQAYARWERGELSDEEFERVQREVVREVLEEQARAGLDLLTDGQVRWYDPVSHLCRGLRGCEIGGLLRFFDTNTYFRQPVVKARVEWVKPLVVEEFKFAKGVSPAPVKPVLTGPYTLARLSINRYYPSFEELLTDLARALGKEVEELARNGAELIQVDEPSILKHPRDLELFKEAIGKLARHKLGARLALYTYFGDAAPIYEELQGLPVEVLGLDFTYSPSLPEVIKTKGSSKALGLGLIDARNTRMEKPAEILPVLKRVLEHVEAELCYLNPSCGLEYLPRDKAFAKLQNLVEIARRVKGGFP